MYEGGTNVINHQPGHMTKMPVYGNILRISSLQDMLNLLERKLKCRYEL